MHQILSTLECEIHSLWDRILFSQSQALQLPNAYGHWGRYLLRQLLHQSHFPFPHSHTPFYEFGIEEGKRYKKEYGYEGRENEIDVAVALRDIYPNVHKHLGAAGLAIERIKFCPTESESHIPECSIFDAWKSIWDKPWFMCEIMSKSHDEGFMKGLNPKLEWTHHAEKDGQEGLARGAAYCKMRLILKK